MLWEDMYKYTKFHTKCVSGKLTAFFFLLIQSSGYQTF